MESVVPVQVSVPFTVKVTGSFGDRLIEVGVGQRARHRGRAPVGHVAGFTVSIVGSVTERLLVAVAGVS